MVRIRGRVRIGLQDPSRTSLLRGQRSIHNMNFFVEYTNNSESIVLDRSLIPSCSVVAARPEPVALVAAIELLAGNVVEPRAGWIAHHTQVHLVVCVGILSDPTDRCWQRPLLP